LKGGRVRGANALRAVTIGQFLVASCAFFGSRSGYEILVKPHRDIGGTACAENAKAACTAAVAGFSGNTGVKTLTLVSPSAALGQMSISGDPEIPIGFGPLIAMTDGALTRK
jgi:hypothetical protein